MSNISSLDEVNYAYQTTDVAGGNVSTRDDNLKRILENTEKYE